MSKELGIHVAIIDNGFAYLGRVIEEENYYVIIQGVNVRRSGTDRGFGQLAIEGPQKESALDPCPPIMVPKNRLCHFIECAEVWKKYVK